MRRLDHVGLLNLREVIEIGGDLVLLPREEAIPHEETRALELAGVLPLADSEIALRENLIFSLELAERYASERREIGVEPGWVHALPISVQTRLRVHFATHEEDVLHIFFELPKTGISYLLREGGFCEDVIRALDLWRLAGIKQLGFLQAPWEDGRMLFRQPLSEGTRFTHSCDVFAIASIIAFNNGISAGPQLRTLQFAALTHDVGTPAGGDSVKLVDPSGLDEDLNYPAILTLYPDAPAVIERYGIDREELFRTIRNEGLLGQILDIADKLAYIARDASYTAHHIEGIAHESTEYGIRTLANHIARYPYVCGVWDAVRVREGHVYFDDPSRLLSFLTLRVLMFRELYYHPRARFGEFMMSRLLVKTLYRRGTITKRELLRMRDDDLMRLMDQAYGSGTHSIGGTIASSEARVESFPDLAQACAFCAALAQEGIVFAMIDDDRRAIRPSTAYLVESPDGLVPLAEAFPSDARIIAEMAGMYPLVHVYYLEGEPAIPQRMLEELRATLSEMQVQAT